MRCHEEGRKSERVKALVMNVGGYRIRNKPKKRCKNCVNDDMSKKEVIAERKADRGK